MLSPATVSTRTVALRVAAAARLARASRPGAAQRDEFAEDLITARLAECIEREMSRVPALRPEQVAALRAIVDGADVPSTLAEVVSVRPAATAA